MPQKCFTKKAKRMGKRHNKLQRFGTTGWGKLDLWQSFSIKMDTLEFYEVLRKLHSILTSQ